MAVCSREHFLRLARTLFRAALLLSLFLPIPAWSGPLPVEEARSRYARSVKDLEQTRQTLAAQYLNADPAQKDEILEQARKAVLEAVTDRLFPAWMGTAWDFNGTTRTPGQGQVACGVFVVRILQDAGFDVPGSMARQPSEYILKNLKPVGPAKRFSDAAVETVAAWVRGQGPGLYITGLDIHVGFVVNDGKNLTFCHSSYYSPPRAVEWIPLDEKSPFTDSRYRVLGKILSRQMMDRWLTGAPFPAEHDYFRDRKRRGQRANDGGSPG